MGPSKKAWPLIKHRLATWSTALKRAIAEHGDDNSFGVVELAGEYRLEKAGGYYLGNHRILEFSDLCGGGVTYRRGRFFVAKRAVGTTSRKMVMKLDPDGLPRAYGVANDVETARRIADEQLALYRKKKLEVDDHYLATAEYSEQIEEVTS